MIVEDLDVILDVLSARRRIGEHLADAALQILRTVFENTFKAFAESRAHQADHQVDKHQTNRNVKRGGAKQHG